MFHLACEISTERPHAHALAGVTLNNHQLGNNWDKYCKSHLVCEISSARSHANAFAGA